MKVSIDDVEHIMRGLSMEAAVVKQVISDLKEIVSQEKAEKEKDKAAEKEEPLQVVLATSDFTGDNTGDVPCFVVEICDPNNIPVGGVMLHLASVVSQYNAQYSGKKKFKPYSTLGDVAERFPKSTLKKAGLRIRFKGPAPIIVVSNTLIPASQDS